MVTEGGRREEVEVEEEEEEEEEVVDEVLCEVELGVSEAAVS